MKMLEHRKPSFVSGCAVAIIFALFSYSAASEAPEHRTAIKAIERGDLGQLKTLLKDGLSPNSYTDEDTLLIKAIDVGNITIIKYLLDEGASPRHTAYRSQILTPMFIAVHKGRLDIVKLLMHAGARLEGCRSVYLAIPTGNTELFEFLMDNGLDPHAPRFGYCWIWAAIGQDSPELIDYVLEKGAEPDYPFTSTVSYAAFQGYNKALVHLLALGADPDKKNPNGKRPIEVASDPDTIKILNKAIIELADD